MLPAANRGAGQSVGFPDVCNTPAGPATVPVPYPNIGMNAQAVGFSTAVKISMVHALNLGSKIAMTSGDEAGVAHPTIKGAGSFTMGSPVVSIDKLPAITLTSPTTGNNMNNALGASLVPSAVNVMMCRALDEVPAGASPRPLADQIADTLAQGSVGGAVRFGGVGILRVPVCSGDLAASALDAALRLLEEGSRALVLDLRGNPGGDLDAALELAGALLPEGAVVAELVDDLGEATAIRARGPARCAAPLVILVDGHTASAAELLAIALQAHARALVVGVPTVGKGWAWTLQVSPDGLPRVGCAARWRGPEGVSVEGRGVQPDLLLDAGCHPDEALEAARALAEDLAAG